MSLVRGDGQTVMDDYLHNKQILTKNNGTLELGMAIQKVWLQEQKSLARQLWSAMCP